MAASLPAFVERRRPDWETLRELLARQRTGTLRLEDLRSLDVLYRRAAADLAHAQTFHAGTDVHRFLNQLCAQAYATIYQPPRERWATLLGFFRHELPRALRAHGAYVATSAGLFLLGLLLGAGVVLLEPRGAELLVPDNLRGFIARREMWTDGILSVAPPSAVASGIATNNLTVTIVTFASGLLFGLGTVLVMLNNGVHLGSVAALCVREGMGPKLFDFIAAHGPVELSIIVIAGGAGLRVGSALVDPGELPRAQALVLRGRESVKLVLGCAPFLALIAGVEGFVSPGDFFSSGVKALLGLALGALFWGYLLRAGRAPA
jgi:uncharacterized membrane protein SpoIIM required for sporulation